MATLKRIKKELLDFNKDPPSNITAGPINDNDLFHWESTIIGPDDSPYEGGIFHLNFTYPDDSFRASKMYFHNKNLSS